MIGTLFVGLNLGAFLQISGKINEFSGRELHVDANNYSASGTECGGLLTVLLFSEQNISSTRGCIS